MYSNKAVHLEYISDLSSEAILAGFVRFVSRRGLPAKIISDHGTNIVGATSILREIQKLVEHSEQKILDYCSSCSIEWISNLPSAPTFGGLWETAVKSAKFHLHRLLINMTLTFEEFSTFLTHVEAVLNSRPLFEP